ncbi:MAG TPA: winged helix DNA-binding domain-containing protein [Acidimicrobiia bacterium]|nr:winged helix DNA-binding domain-containing protein [Acidimicrobiia bacterium]
MPGFSNEQRRARFARRHALAPGFESASMPETASSLLAIHATDPATVFLSTWARVPGITRPEIEASLYEERSVVRVMGMRRTLFVVPVETFPLVDVGAGRELADRERRRLLKLLSEADVAPDADGWLARVEAATLEALAARGEATAADLARDVPELRVRLTMGSGRWAAEIALSSRVVFLLATAGRIVRSRPRGTWLSNQWRWVVTDRWLGSRPEPSTDEARAELAALYLERFGPATETDVIWWTGWTKTAARAALARIAPEEVELANGRGYVLPGDSAESGAADPWVALLPALDSTIMGWKERDWYLGPHGGAVFDTNGNSGPVVVVDGRVVGGWAQAPDASVVFEIIDDVSDGAVAAVAERAAELTDWLEGDVVMPRFSSPLHRRLATGG